MSGYHPRAFDIERRPKAAAKEILEAVRAAKGSTTKAAKKLRVSYRTLTRYISKLQLQADVERIREEAAAS